MARIVLAVLFLTSSAYAQVVPTYETVVLSHGDVKFPMQPPDKEQYERYCPLDVCTCESDVSYVRLRAPANSNALALINRALKAEASKVQCTYPDATDSMQQEITHLSARFVSVVERSYSQQIATGGSCHGSSAVHTFDLSSGKEYVLAEIISRLSLASLRSTLPTSIVKEHNRQEDEFAEAEEKANSLSHHTPPVESPENLARDLKSARAGLAALRDEQLLTSPIFIQRGRVFINIEDYLFGCVGGPFHPAEVPTSLIALPLLRQELTVR